MPQSLPYLLMNCTGQDEHARIKAKATELGLSVSNYLRKLNGLEPIARKGFTSETARLGQSVSARNKRAR